jgi:hypothetical protein
MTENSGEKIYNIFISSANRGPIDKPYDFSVLFYTDEILDSANEEVNVKVHFKSPT